MVEHMGRKSDPNAKEWLFAMSESLTGRIYQDDCHPLGDLELPKESYT